METPFVQTLLQLLPILKKEKLPDGFEVTCRSILADGNFLDRERINILISFWHLPPMTQHFYDYYFGDVIDSIEKFTKGINRFIKDAIWHFGDFQRAYYALIDEEEMTIEDRYNAHNFNLNEFGQRLPWTLIKPIKPEDRGLLGYVSGEKPFRQKAVLSNAEEIIKVLEDKAEEFSGLSTDKIADAVLETLKEKMPDMKKTLEEIREMSSLRDLDLFSSAKMEENKIVIDTAKAEIEKTIQKVDEVKNAGRQNQEQYLRNIESIDVYVATSMRDDKEYQEMYEFVRNTFDDSKLKEFNLRFFDPTLCYCDSRLDKGIIECLLVRSSKLTIYCAQEGDTFGKDSELAATLVQGKPVIVFVPQGSEKLDRRANIFKEFHPLGLQIGLYDGVARGVIVVRSPEECVEIIRRIITNSLEVDIKFEEHGIVLREKLTNSVVRVMSGWGTLSSTFWNNFHKTQEPKTGNCI